MANKNLSDFAIIEGVPTNVVQTPAFLTGDFGQAVYRAYEEERASRFENNPNLRLQAQEGVIIGSTPFDVILVNQIIRRLRGTPRTALPSDLSNPRVLEMIKGKHYVDSQGLVLRGTIDSRYPKNNPLARHLAEQEGVDLAKLEREPALITGLDLEPWNEGTEGYRLKLVTSEDESFAVHHDDRFLEKYDSYRFDTVDALGLPVGLSRDSGSRTWYTRKDGLSRLYVSRGSNLYSYWYYLDDSNSNGRVVIIGGEATAKNSDELSVNLETQRTDLETKLGRIRRAQAILRGE